MPSYRRRSRSVSRSRSPPRRRREDVNERDRRESEGRSRRRDDKGYDDRARENSSRRRSRSRSVSKRGNYNADGRMNGKEFESGSGGAARYRGSRSLSRSPPSSKNASRSGQPLPSQSSMLVSAGVPGGTRNKGRGSRSPSPSAEAIAASKPNFANSGALAAETNSFQGRVLKYHEDVAARKPTKKWRLYVFKGAEQIDVVHVNKQSAYLFGRDKIVADIHIEHPSISKQHAVLQFRSVHERSEFGDTKQITKPYLIDLDSANGTSVNEEKIPPSRYYELKSSDVVRFAYSTREYVLMVEQ